MTPREPFQVDAATWAELNRLLDGALDLAPEDRAAWLDRLDPRYDALKPRLRDLLSRAGLPRPLLATLGGAVPLEWDPAAGPASAESAGQLIGPYRLLRELGRGGMGAVWLAERTDGLIDRPVALKLPLGAWSQHALAARLAQERKILASLSHPHIARLYDAGLTDAGKPWLALEYVNGRPIDEYCRSQRVGIVEQLRLFLDVLDAVAYAHGRLVVHRDLKPSNILVSDEHQVRLLDFGIARLLDDEGAGSTLLTQTAGCPLTPEYASPEQIRGGSIGVASDIYSLGVVLYELLTGARPYRLKRDSRGALEDAIVEAEPKRPSDLVADAARRRALHGDLDTIVLKALAKHPDERYVTAHAFADDIRNRLSNRPVKARPASALYRFSKFARRNRIAVGAASAALLAIGTGVGVAVWQARIAINESRRAEEVKAFIAGIFQDANLDESQGRSVTALEVLKRANDRIDQTLDAGPSIRVELMNVVGSSLMSLGDSATAEAVAERAVLEAGHLPPSDPQAIRARLVRAWVLMHRGKTPEMRQELDAVFPLLHANSSVPTTDLVFAWRLRSGLSVDEGNPAEAQAAGREAVKLAEAGLSEHHRERLLALLDLAYAYSQGRGTAAQQLETSERASRLATDAHHGNLLHPTVMKARAAYGSALANNGRLDEGITLLRDARGAAGQLFGPASLTVAVYSQNLVDFELRSGRIRDALDSSAQAFDIYQQLPVDSYTAMSVQRMRGIALSAARQMTDALPVLDKAVQTSTRALGPTHRLTLENRALRARVLGYTGVLGEAARELTDVVAQMQAGKHPTLYVPLRFQSVVAQLQGNHETAVTLGQQALQLMREAGATNVWRGRMLTEIAASQLALGRTDEALPALEEARGILSHADGRVDPDLADVYVGLATARMRRQEWPEAITLLEQADRFWREFAPASPWALDASRLLAQCRQALAAQ